jgi:hypothetical protein
MLREGEITPKDPRELLIIWIMRIFRMLPIDRMLSFTASTYPFTDYFKGFEKVDAVRQLFGERTEQVLQNLKVEFSSLGGYMRVSDADGHLIVNSRYLNNGDKVDIYLDIIHELVHVKQFMEGKELFDAHYGYADRPTEIEAYRHAVKEARRMGLSDERICEYLKTEWMSTNDLNQLAKALNVKCTHPEVSK